MSLALPPPPAPSREELLKKLHGKCAAVRRKGAPPSRATLLKQMGLDGAPRPTEPGSTEPAPANERLDAAMAKLRSELTKKGTKKMLRDISGVAKRVTKILGEAGPLPGSSEPVSGSAEGTPTPPLTEQSALSMIRDTMPELEELLH